MTTLCIPIRCSPRSHPSRDQGVVRSKAVTAVTAVSWVMEGQIWDLLIPPRSAHFVPESPGLGWLSDEPTGAQRIPPRRVLGSCPSWNADVTP